MKIAGCMNIRSLLNKTSLILGRKEKCRSNFTTSPLIPLRFISGTPPRKEEKRSYFNLKSGLATRPVARKIPLLPP